MSIIYILLTLFACAISGVFGAYGMRFVTERNREIAEQEDPRDTKIRELQAKIKLISVDITRDRTRAKEATDHVRLAHERIIELTDEIKSLKRVLENQDALKDNKNDELELLKDKLSLAHKQLDTLRVRNQELEVELSVVNEPNMLESLDSDDEPEENEVDPFTPDVADNSPSLIHALTDELDRWKRHCHVLGDELKSQRERVTEADEFSDASVTTPIIDELTDIRGIGSVLARKLHMLGIYSYDKLLNLSTDDLERAQQLIPDFERRMERDGWLEQARMLQASKYPQSEQQADSVART